METGELIAQIRIYRGKSRQELADVLGITKQRMSALESSKDVAFSTLQRICNALDFEIMAFPKEARPPKEAADIILTENEARH